QDQINWHAHEPKGKLFGPTLELSRSPRPRVFTSTDIDYENRFSQMDRKGPFPPQKLAIEVRGSPTYILGHLPFHNQCGTIQQSLPSHIVVPQPLHRIRAPLAHGPSGYPEMSRSIDNEDTSYKALRSRSLFCNEKILKAPSNLPPARCHACDKPTCGGVDIYASRANEKILRYGTIEYTNPPSCHVVHVDE
uniref:Uncharacterized protein n=1 Tax=Oryza glaberrima TaxID=4538 RepID=I1QI58_ORYGL